MHPGDRRLLQETVLWIRLVIHILLLKNQNQQRESTNSFNHSNVIMVLWFLQQPPLRSALVEGRNEIERWGDIDLGFGICSWSTLYVVRLSFLGNGLPSPRTSGKW
uniref:Uncharacterized protein n=1 Tax=Nelumbo nucifera TaxID=4432 RepID=A0A822YPW2_NELNU|nr:TPA_asm: hypothetical protein HUJ06_006844 [Nelumbo nucifera]